MDTALETKIYQELLDHLNRILAEHGSPNECILQKKWRGLITLNCFKGFLETALNTQQNNPHEIMAILDHMFVQLVELYQNIPTDPVGQPDNSDESSNVCAVPSSS